MIEKIKNAVTCRLHDVFGTACEIYTEEVAQGAELPFVFVEMFPTEFTLENNALERQTIGVRMAYIPKVYSQDEMTNAAISIKRAFLYQPLSVDGRAVSTYHVAFDIADDCLIGTMAYEIYVDPGIIDESGLDTMQNMELNLKKE